MAKKSPEDAGQQRLTISLPTKLYAEIDNIAKRDSRSMAWVLRKAAEMLVAEENPLFYPRHGKKAS